MGGTLCSKPSVVGRPASAPGCSQMAWSSCLQVEITHLSSKLAGALGALVGNPQNQRGASWLNWIDLSPPPGTLDKVSILPKLQTALPFP